MVPHACLHSNRGDAIRYRKLNLMGAQPMSTFDADQDANVSTPQRDEGDCLHHAHYLANDGEYYCMALR